MAQLPLLNSKPEGLPSVGLENRYGSLAHREFKSLPLRQFSKGRFLTPATRSAASAARALADSFKIESKGAWSSTASRPCFHEEFETRSCRSLCLSSLP